MEEIGQVYARALFEVAQQQGDLDGIREQLAQFADALDAERSLQTFFFSPYFSSEEKKDGLHKALTGADDAVVNFLELLIEKHRTPAIFRIRREFDRMWREERKMLPVQLTSAIELDAQTVENLGRTIGERTGRKVDVTAQVDPNILGGIVLRVGNSILDASIRNRLEQLRKQVARS
ncbi:MAG TPA: ATP synthase F1 subunit delta [Capillimicrobium sp.]